ncbi:unnamed protein product, partial [Amoebophrya sp. A120]
RPEEGVCYKLFGTGNAATSPEPEKPKTASEANAYCKQQHPNAVLATIRTTSQNTFVQNMVAEFEQAQTATGSSSGTPKVFLGAHYNPDSLTSQIGFYDNTVPVPSLWTPLLEADVNLAGTNDCTKMNTANGRWQPEPCTNENAFICSIHSKCKHGFVFIDGECLLVTQIPPPYHTVAPFDDYNSTLPSSMPIYPKELAEEYCRLLAPLENAHLAVLRTNNQNNAVQDLAKALSTNVQATYFGLAFNTTALLPGYEWSNGRDSFWKPDVTWEPFDYVPEVNEKD